MNFNKAKMSKPKKKMFYFYVKKHKYFQSWTTDIPCSFTHLLGQPFLNDVNLPASPRAHRNQQKVPVSRDSKGGHKQYIPNPSLGNWP